ncbi:MAG: septum formation protein Maf [Bacteroidales bacterium]|nr:septum formation protein Maf [Bacteroidales bacterium]
MQPYSHAIFGNRRLLLASASPRRRELLGLIGIDVVTVPLQNIDESYPSVLSPAEVPEYISRKKAAAYTHPLAPEEILVTADTVVINNGSVLGKPADEFEAARMLALLSGHAHSVVTGVTLVTSSGSISFSDTTHVEFADLSEEEIAYYINNYHPLDKAGAYGIQEWIGYIGVKGICGDYYNVMGLPLRKLYEHIRALD